MTKQEQNLVKDLLANYAWPRGSAHQVVLKHLAANPSKKLHARDRKILNMICQKAKGLARQQVKAQAQRNRNQQRESRQLAAMRSGR
jgi:hypothetical protein